MNGTSIDQGGPTILADRRLRDGGAFNRGHRRRRRLRGLLCFRASIRLHAFVALLGDEPHGRWRIAPISGGRCTRRRYLPDTLVLETEWETPEGTVRVTDCMPPRGVAPDLVRVIEGVKGRVTLRSELRIRFDYGRVVPWVTV